MNSLGRVMSKIVISLFLYRRPLVTNDDTFCMASSVTHRFTLNNRQPSWFKIAAEGYLLSGNFNDICDHNARVAIGFGKTTVIIYLYSYISMCIHVIITLTYF